MAPGARLKYGALSGAKPKPPSPGVASVGAGAATGAVSLAGAAPTTSPPGVAEVGAGAATAATGAVSLAGAAPTTSPPPTYDYDPLGAKAAGASERARINSALLAFWLAVASVAWAEAAPEPPTAEASSPSRVEAEAESEAHEADQNDAEAEADEAGELADGKVTPENPVSPEAEADEAEELAENQAGAMETDSVAQGEDGHVSPEAEADEAEELADSESPEAEADEAEESESEDSVPSHTARRLLNLARQTEQYISGERDHLPRQLPAKSALRFWIVVHAKPTGHRGVYNSIKRATEQIMDQGSRAPRTVMVAFATRREVVLYIDYLGKRDMQWFID